VEDAAGDADGDGRADAEDHVADLADGVIGQEPLEVLLDEGHEDGQDDGHGPDDHEQDGHRAPGPDLEEVDGDAGQEVDAQELLERGRQEGHEGHRRVDRGVRDPGVKGHGPGLAAAPIIIRTKAAAARPVGSTEMSDRVAVPATVQSRAMPRIMQKSQKPLMSRALTAVRPDVTRAADRDHAVEGDQEALPEKDQRDEVVGQRGAVGERGGQEDVGTNSRSGARPSS